MRKMVLLLVLSFWPCAVRGGAGDWISIGPYGAEFMTNSTIVIDPHDPQTIYAGTGEAGIFKSQDGGSNWRAINDGFPRFSFYTTFAIEIDPNDPNIVYSAIRFQRGVACIFKSMDGGESWRELSSQPTTEKRYELRSIVVDPGNPQVMYAAIEGGGVFKSTHGGESWQEMNQGLADKRVEVLAIDPDQPQIVYAGTAMGMLKTTDGGLTWKSTGLTGVAAVRCIALDPTNAQVVYAGTVRGVYKSTDRGESWEDMSQGLDNLNVRAIAIDSEDPRIIYVGTDENIHSGFRGKVYKSTDGGESWTAVGTDLTKFGIGAIAVNPEDPQIIYAGSTQEEGIFRSMDGGQTWQQSNRGLTNMEILSMAIDPTDPRILYAATEFLGVFKSTDRGLHWTPINNGIKGIRQSRLTIDPSDPQCLYVINGNGLISKTTDGGETWIDIPETRWFVLDPQNSQHLYGMDWEYQLIETMDGGTSWQTVEPYRATPRAIDPDDPQILYGTRRDSVLKSIDGGVNWTGSELPGSPGYIRGLVIDWSDPEILYAWSNVVLTRIRGGLFKSTDGGASWRRIEEGLTNIDILDIRIDPRDSRVLYAATGNGLFISRNGGERWEEVDTGQGLRVFFSVADPQNPDIVYLGTDGKGAFKGVIHTGLTGVEEEVKRERPWAFRLYPNYPNPFNAATGIMYHLPETSMVRIEIFDILGQKVRTLVSGRRSAGAHRVVWDGTREDGRAVGSGVYLCSVRAGDFSAARRIVLLR